MRVFALSAAVLALASSVLAQTAGFDAISKPAEKENVPAGAPYDIVWTPGTVTGTITLSVIGGATPATLVDKGTIAAKVDNTLGKFSWNVPTTLGSDAVYGIKIVLDSDPNTFQFSFPFQIVGGGAAAPNTTVTSASTVTATVTLTSGSVTLTSSVTPTTTPVTDGGFTPSGNLSTGGAITSTRTITRTAGGTSTTTTPRAPSSTGAADALKAGSFAVLGGLAIAALAL